MTKLEIPNIAIGCLSGLLDRPGSILYSSHETLRPGDAYVLGYNPGGSAGSPIQMSIDELLTKTTNAYLDEKWEHKNRVWPEGEAPLQKNMKWIVESLGLCLREVCTSNLIFFQSPKASDINSELADQCWPVHRAIIAIIKPKIIIAFGNNAVDSPYAYLHARFGGTEESIPSGHGDWKVKGFKSYIDGHPLYMAGLPHLSRYSAIGKNYIIDWLSEGMRKAVNK